MFSIVSKLFGSTEKKETEFKAYVFEIEGTGFSQLEDEAVDVTFEGEGADATLNMLDLSFPVAKIQNLERFHDENDGGSCFQWSIKKKKDFVQQFGLKFVDVSMGQEFGAKLNYYLQEQAAILCDVRASLDMFDNKIKEWTSCGSDCQVMICQRDDFESFLTISEKDNCIVSRAVAADMGCNFDDEELMFRFFGPGPDGSANCLLNLQFNANTTQQYTELKDAIRRVELEKLARSRNTADVAMWEPDDEDEKQEEDDMVWYESVEDRPNPNQKVMFEGGGENKFMQVSELHGRAFVCRGTPGKKQRIQLIARKDDELVDEGELGELVDTKGNAFDASKAMLHENERKMLFISDTAVREDKTKVFCMDIERQKVVEEWDTQGVPIFDIMSSAKDNQRTGEQTFLGTNSRTMMTLDPRLSGATGQRAECLTYATNVGINVGSTDKSGHIALAGSLGDFRLFDGTTNRDGNFKRAKTLIPGLGATVKHIDVSADGKWILGTCAKFLVLVPTSMEDGKTGFTKAMGKMKPRPIQLQIHSSDVVKYNLTHAEINFTPAKFDMNDRGDKEALIVTSIRDLAITWDFKRAKAGDALAYQIKQIDDTIVGTHLARNTAASVVVATYDGVQLAERARG